MSSASKDGDRQTFTGSINELTGMKKPVIPLIKISGDHEIWLEFTDTSQSIAEIPLSERVSKEYRSLN